eukprot:TRINITY_DN68094_c11_g1_i1.p2 TRINITY_DN68094_c11_g1~~TRINITY_DN68094_c11_g1_i1.p2  ORF type:complete len:145 (+),score=57.36 TRINITY_DN68094_c11_g1_i1:1448-1882(+)
MPVDADYAWKVTDEVFVHVPNVLAKLKSMPRRRLWLGKMLKNVKRDDKAYTASMYPMFASPNSSIMSRDLVRYLGARADLWKAYKREDVSVGIWMASARHTAKNEGNIDAAACSKGVLSLAKVAPQTMARYWESVAECGHICGC